MKITSSSNKWIKEIRKLNNKKYRRQSGLFVAEGLRFIESLLSFDVKMEAFLYDEEIFSVENSDDTNTTITSIKKEVQNIIASLRKNSEAKIIEVSSDVIHKLFDTKTPQGVLAIVHQKKSTFEELLSSKKPIMILDRLQDAGNLGTLIRTADCADMGGVILLTGCVDMYNDKVLRSTMGGVCSVPILENIDWYDVKDRLMDAGYKILAADVHSDYTIYDEDYNTLVVVIIGNEANGIAEHILNDKMVKRITIPNMGRMESLNASVAGSIIMYEMLRQRIG